MNRRAMLALVASLALAACARREVGATAKLDGVTVRRAVAWTMGETRSATAGFEIDVAGLPDTLVGVSSPAGRAGLHATQGAGGMHEVPALALATGRTMVDGRIVHVMVRELSADIPVGGTLPVELRFARAGRMTLDLPVLRFSDALTALGR